MADMPTTTPKDQAIAAQKAALPKLLVPATMGDLEQSLQEYAYKAIPLQNGKITPQQQQVAAEISTIRGLNAHAGRGNEEHNRAYFHAILSFVERYSVAESEKQKAGQLAALVDPDKKKRNAAVAREDDLDAKNLAAVMTGYKTQATKAGEDTAKLLAEYSKKLSDGVTSFFGTAVAVGKEAVADPKAAAKKATDQASGAAASATDRVKDFFKDMDFGKILSGGAFALLGYFLAGIFGEGFMGTIASVLLPIGMFFMGSSSGFGDTINGWLGRPSNTKQAAAQGQQLQRDGAQTQGQGQGKGQGTPAPQNQAALSDRFSQEELNAMLADARSKGVQAQTVTFERHNDTIKPVIYDVRDARSQGRGAHSIADVQAALNQCRRSGPAAVVFNEIGQGGEDQMACAPKRVGRMDSRVVTR